MDPQTQTTPQQTEPTAGQSAPQTTPAAGAAIPQQSTPTVSQPNTTSIEEQVAKELGNTLQGASTDSLDNKSKKLAESRQALEKKIASLENDVKTKLETLKALKTTLEEEIKEINELKKTEATIDIELQKIEELEKKRAEIEHEIKTIEETTQNL